MSKKNQLKNKKNLLLFLILLLVAFGSYYLYKTYSLKTYNNDEYGFEFKYNNNSKILYEGRENNSPYLYLLRLQNDDLSKDAKYKGDEQYFDLQINKGKECSLKEKDLTSPISRSIKIDGINANYIEGLAAYNKYWNSICLIKDSNSYWFSNTYSNDASETVKNNSRKMFNEIISSFKFNR